MNKSFANASEANSSDSIELSSLPPEENLMYNNMRQHFENLLLQNVEFYQRSLIIQRRRFEQRRKRRQQLLRNFYARLVFEMETNLIETVPMLIMDAIRSRKNNKNDTNDVENIEKFPRLISPKFCFYKNALLHYNEHEWLSAFRLTKETFHWLCVQLRDSLTGKLDDSDFDDKLTLEKPIALALYTLASGENSTNISALFSVSQTVVHKILNLFVKEIVTKLSKYLLVMPKNASEYQEVRQGFRRLSNMPELVVGVLGLMRVPLFSDTDNGAGDASNHILMQTLIDDRFLFRKVQHLDKEPNLLLNKPNELTILPKVKINGKELSPFIVTQPGVSPLRSWILQPYDEPVCPHEFDFNEAFEQLQAVQQQAHRRLFARWRILHRNNIGINIIYPETITTVCVMLHNLLEENEEEYLDEWEYKFQMPNPQWKQQSTKQKDDAEAIAIRDFLAKTISSTEM